METEIKLSSTNLESSVITHSRIKALAAEAHSSEDHISRLALALSLAEGAVESDWAPTRINGEVDLFTAVSGKQIRGKTLFKDDLPIWMALALQNQKPSNYSDWRSLMLIHWERGIQILISKFIQEGDWLRTIRSCIYR